MTQRKPSATEPSINTKTTDKFGQVVARFDLGGRVAAMDPLQRSGVLNDVVDQIDEARTQAAGEFFSLDAELYQTQLNNLRRRGARQLVGNSVEAFELLADGGLILKLSNGVALSVRALHTGVQLEQVHDVADAHGDARLFTCADKDPQRFLRMPTARKLKQVRDAAKKNPHIEECGLI